MQRYLKWNGSLRFRIQHAVPALDDAFDFQYDRRLVASRAEGASDSRPFAYCVQQVQSYDREDYVWIGQIAKELRPMLFALYAFNVETALIPDQVSQPALAEVRYQWWREAVNSMSTKTPLKHPLIQSLAQVCGTAAAPRYRLQRLISTREESLKANAPPNSLDDLEHYADGTTAQIQALQLELAGIRHTEADHAASHLGKAIGLAIALRGTSRHATRRQTYLPVELMAQAGVSQEALYRRQESDGLAEVVFRVASLAKGHLDEARKLQKSLPSEASQLMLGAVGCGLYLQALEKHNFQILSPGLQNGGYSPLWHLLNVKYCLLRGTY